MIILKTKNIAIISGLLIIGGSLFLTTSAFAEDSNNQSLLERISEKFNLKKDDVQNVASDFRSEKLKSRQAKHRTRLEQRLEIAVKDGKLTETQKNAILQKMDEIQKRHEAERTELLNWAKQNGLENFGMGFGKFGLHGFRMGRDFDR